VGVAGELRAEDDAGVKGHHRTADIPESGGCRKVRWSRAGTGKRGGVRVIYFTRLPSGEIWLLLVYAKSVRDNIPGHLLKAVRKEIENG
jgi:hypothetical protein